ncbi:MAG TPA: adenine phosphoribosyltransferase [Bacteroidales bacterium]|nr:adenine phosphoribosyltransferase [Bacteroidales bacterium]
MDSSVLAGIRESIRNVPDFPIKGIQFKDITTAIKHPVIFNHITDILAEHYSGKGITKVVAIESRGFIIGGALAYKLNAGFVPVRKPGKLPAVTYSVTYDLEYGKDSLQMHQDALHPDDIVLLHDDLLATGGTALATLNLIRKFNVKKAYVCFIAELDFLKGRNRLSPPYEVFSLAHFNE